MTTSDAVPLLTVRDLVVAAGADGNTRTIVSGATIQVSRGETVGIVGESGSGKSMLSKAVTGLLPRGVRVVSGEAHFDGQNLLGREANIGRVRGAGISLLLQDPFTMLNPLMRCGDQVAEGVRLAGRTSKATAAADVSRRLAEVGLDASHVSHRYPFQLSGGMRQRVALAAALSRDPELLIADEPSTALDVTTQAEILALLQSEQARRGMGLVLITHDLQVAFSVCDRVYVLYAGSILESAPAGQLHKEPLHPYSLGLLLSEPSVERRRPELSVIEGTVPSPDDVADRCAFADRCAWVADVCTSSRPDLRAIDDRRRTACVRVGEIRAELGIARRAGSGGEVNLDVVEVAKEAPPLVAITVLRKVFTVRGQHQVTAVDGVSLDIGHDECVGLVGESGSGKTTIGRCIVGLETPTSGSIVVDGTNASDYGAASRSERRALRSAAQMVFQDPYSSLDPKQSIGAALAETLRVTGTESSEIRGRVVELLDLVGLPSSYVKRPPRMLSGGERQRIAIARALAVDPRFIVCDEPVSALDVSVQAQILNLLRRLRETRKVSYLFITHDLAVVRQIADRLYVLYKGCVVEHGPTAMVLDNPQHWYTKKLLSSVPSSGLSAGTG